MEEKKGSVFSRLFAKKRADTEEVEIEDQEVSRIADTLPHTVLRLTPEQEAQMSFAEIADLRAKLAKMPPLVIGEINFIPFEAGYYMDGYYVKVFIRNGKDLMDEISFEQIPLYLVDATGEKVAGGVFKPQNFGTLKFGETRVWTFAWRPNQVYKKPADFSAFSVVFE